VPPTSPHLIAFFDQEEKKKNAAHSQMSVGYPISGMHVDTTDQEEFEEYSVFFCTCGSNFRVRRFVDINNRQEVADFLESVVKCGCDHTPDKVRLVQAPLNAAKIPLSYTRDMNNKVSLDSYSQFEASIDGCYDVQAKRFLAGEVSQGYTAKVYPTKRPSIFFWSKAPGRQDVIRDVTYSTARGRTCLPDGFTSNALHSLVGGSHLGDLSDWASLVTQFLNRLGSKLQVTDFLYILSCPYILRYNVLTSCMLSNNEPVDVYPDFLEQLVASGTFIRSPKQVFSHVLPKHLRDTANVLDQSPLGKDFYLPALYLISKHFTDQKAFSTLTRNLIVLGSKFMRTIMSSRDNFTPDSMSNLIGFIASKVNQDQLANILASCSTPPGTITLVGFHLAMREARLKGIDKNLDSLTIPADVSSIHKFVELCQVHLANQAVRA